MCKSVLAERRQKTFRPLPVDAVTQCGEAVGRHVLALGDRQHEVLMAVNFRRNLAACFFRARVLLSRRPAFSPPNFYGFTPPLTMIDEPSAGSHYGGEVAAPVFSNVMAGALRMLGVAQ
ncbi:MAG: hypothetical protein Q8J75_03255 [Rhodocyclaceae bacterium]|nr:hypothetical protein [Rhodocyclaceae bacterium]